MKPSQIKKATEQAEIGNPQTSAPRRLATSARSGPSVKDMPKHDPDGEVIALTLTIPSWQESIERVISVADLESVSADAKDKAQKALSSLVAAATSLLTFIKEAKMSFIKSRAPAIEVAYQNDTQPQLQETVYLQNGSESSP